MTSHVVVVGCGLAGLTCAYFLRQHDLEVTVIDRQPAPARETSYANGSIAFYNWWPTCGLQASERRDEYYLSIEDSSHHFDGLSGVRENDTAV